MHVFNELPFEIKPYSNIQQPVIAAVIYLIRGTFIAANTIRDLEDPSDFEDPPDVL